MSEVEGGCSAGYTCSSDKYCEDTSCINTYSWGCINSDSSGVYASTWECVKGATSASDPANLCPAGHFCPEGSIVAEPCPIGTYLSSTGASLKSECVSCDAGSSCEHRGLTAPGDPC